MAQTQSNTVLTPEWQSFLQGGRPVILATVNESGEPILSVISWVAAIDEGRVLLAMDPRSASMVNIGRTGRATLQVLGRGTSLVIRCTGQVAQERIDGVSFPVGIAELQVEEARENFFFGGRLDQDPTYSHTWDPAKAGSLDETVYSALRSLTAE